MARFTRANRPPSLARVPRSGRHWRWPRCDSQLRAGNNVAGAAQRIRDAVHRGESDRSVAGVPRGYGRLRPGNPAQGGAIAVLASFAVLVLFIIGGGFVL